MTSFCCPTKQERTRNIFYGRHPELTKNLGSSEEKIQWTEEELLVLKDLFSSFESPPVQILSDVARFLSFPEIERFRIEMWFQRERNKKMSHTPRRPSKHQLMEHAVFPRGPQDYDFYHKHPELRGYADEKIDWTDDEITVLVSYFLMNDNLTEENLNLIAKELFMPDHQRFRIIDWFENQRAVNFNLDML